MLSFSLTTAPSGMSIASMTGMIGWTPTLAQVGSHNVTVRVTDQAGLFVEQTFTITFATSPPTNRAPTFTSTSLTAAIAGQPYAYPVTATDPDAGDVLTFSPPTAPTGMTIHATTGLIAWTPTLAQLGSHNATVRVTDVGGLYTEQSFTIEVRATNSGPVAVAGLLNAPGLPACVAPPAGLVSWYPGDGNAADTFVGPNSPNMTIGSPQFVAGKVGQGIRFDGSSGLIVPNHPTFDFKLSDSFTIDTWVRVDGNGGNSDNAIVDKRENSEGIGYNMDAWLPPSSPTGTTKLLP